MHSIANDQLTVSLLDPTTDHPAHGGRYCRGGYIWQVSDSIGELLSGPEYPHQAPSSFNGQGLPEVFRPTNKQQNERLTQHEDGTGLIIGIGQCKGGFTPQSVAITQAVAWDVDNQDHRITFTCEDAVAPWHYRLERTVSLEGRRLTVRSTVTNLGADTLPVQWYAHPFFQHDTEGFTDCRFTAGIRCPEGDGYVAMPGGLQMDREANWDANGHFLWLDVEDDTELDAALTHSRLPGIRLQGDFAIEVMPVWANCNTLSIEPYLRRDLEAGAATQWSLTYTFGG